MSTIEIENIGPIAKLSIPVPEDGGVVVLKSTNDCGKSETIEALAAALNGQGRLDVRRGCVKGTLKGFGVNVTVGRSTKRTGELEVQSLEGRLSIEDLIEPKLKDPGAADAKRIKTLIQVTGAKASPELFHGLVGGRESFDAVVSSSATATDDLVVMAERIKRDFEKAARNEESQAEHAQGRALGAREAAAGVDVSVESDPSILQLALEDAIRRESQLKAARTAHAEAVRASDRAKLSLEDIEASYTGPTLQQAIELQSEANSDLDAAIDRVRDIEKQLSEAKAVERECRVRQEAAAKAVSEAERVEKLVDGWKVAIAKAVPHGPSDDELVAAADAVSHARQAVEAGALVRRAREHMKEAAAATHDAVKHKTRAEMFRDAAKKTDDVLSDLVSSCGTPLRVEAGRLMVDTDQGPKTFAELSHGKRSRIALAIAIDAVGEGGVICLKQEFWEGVAPAKKRELAQQAREGRVLVLTAQATDDETIVSETL